MASTSRTQLARDLYLAFAAGNREVVESMIASDFTFSSPVDVGLDRAGYFLRCWPGSGQQQQFDFVRLVEDGDEVIVTYDMTRGDGARGRNTEVLTFNGDQVIAAEVYFGWDLQ